MPRRRRGDCLSIRLQRPQTRVNSRIFVPDGHELGFALPLLPGFRAIATRSGLPFQEAAAINDASDVKRFTFFHYRLSVEQNSFATRIEDNAVAPRTRLARYPKPPQSRTKHVSLLILVVDDESDVEMLFRQQFRRDLRAGRFTMDFAQSADSALQRISDTAGASLILILSDINMPGMSGLELLPKAKARSTGRSRHYDHCLRRR